MSGKRRKAAARPEYVDAFRRILERIAAVLEPLPSRVLPVRLVVAGGAALHFHVGERVSRDIDAVFSHRIVLPENLEATYRDPDGGARVLYFDRQYNDSFALMHEDASDDAEPLRLEGIDPAVLDVRILTPLDLAVSKIARFSPQDREDIASLARHGLIDSTRLERRAREALAYFVGDTARAATSIDLACRIVKDMDARRGRKGRSRRSPRA